mgnify:CR=1 FL=1
MSVVTRFAPSPTGFLHVGGARTALFNWLYARHTDGLFRLRIEDTDRKRSSEESVDAIFRALEWLEIGWDDDVVFQFSRAPHHAELARDLLVKDKAYFCFATPEELADMRAKARAEGHSQFYDRRWRDRDPNEAPAGIDPVIRLKAPLHGETTIEDLVQGSVTVANEQIDDMVLLRADGTPTYMLSVVVDDHDMGVTHIIRGDDHLNNAFRQQNLFSALGWEPPLFAHIPLIHGPDGTKLSKRHGALSVDAYHEAGFLPEAMRNYLLRLGWSHGDDEIISTDQSISWFDIGGIGKSPARFDFTRLESLNSHYLSDTGSTELLDLLHPLIAQYLGAQPTNVQLERVTTLLPLLKKRSKTILELIDNAKPFIDQIPTLDTKARTLLTHEARQRLSRIQTVLAETESWEIEALETLVRGFAESEQVKLKDVAQPLRAALTGRTVSPPIFDVMFALGRSACLERLSYLKD